MFVNQKLKKKQLMVLIKKSLPHVRISKAIFGQKTNERGEMKPRLLPPKKKALYFHKKKEQKYTPLQKILMRGGRKEFVHAQ